MSSNSVLNDSAHTIMESLLQHQAFSTTYQIAAETLNYFSGELNSNDVPETIPTYSLKEVSIHDSFNDCWIVIFDKIYDLGKFMNEHPGGYDVLFENAGLDATTAFRSVGHSKEALHMMKKYCIGQLVENERMYSLRKKKKSIFNIMSYGNKDF